jgi:hypothetical protein
MDNKFAKVSDHIPNVAMNTPAALEHISEIECRIHVIKERAMVSYALYPTPIFLNKY